MEDKLALYQDLTDTVINCRLCPRLVHFRETVPPRTSYKNETYWRRPVPGFGDLEAWLLILGLAPAIHGGNRTGRIFTGDESARFLMRNLYQKGFANQPISVSKDDGLELKGCYITPVVKCVPPKHKPIRQEYLNCSRYLLAELQLLNKIKAVLALGKFAFDGFVSLGRSQGYSIPSLKFEHGEKYHLERLPILYASYHPSPQNTFTGKLTDQMFLDVLSQIKKDCETVEKI